MRFDLVLALLLVAACAQAPSVAAGPPNISLVGTWRLLSVVAIRPNGDRISSRFGPNPIGYIIYDGTGHMSVQIMANPWPVFVEPDKPTQHELEAVLKGYLAYAGTYDFDAAARTVTHHVQMSVNPDYLGRNLRRTVELEGDRITLTAQQAPLNGEQVTVRLQWERLR